MMSQNDDLTSQIDATSDGIWYADDPPEDAYRQSDDIASDDITSKLTGKEKNTHSQVRVNCSFEGGTGFEIFLDF